MLRTCRRALRRLSSVRLCNLTPSCSSCCRPALPCSHSRFPSTTPKTPAELRPQYAALCRALDLDPSSPSLAALRDPSRVPASAITRAIETDALGTEHGTFRGCREPRWLGGDGDAMAWQRTGGLARGLAAHGVRSVAVGDLSEEWYLYSIAHPVRGMRDVARNLERYYRADAVKRMLEIYLGAGDGGEEDTAERAARVFGDVLAEGQVHLPVRLFARDMLAARFPLVRYEIRWTPEQLRPLGV